MLQGEDQLKKYAEYEKQNRVEEPCPNCARLQAKVNELNDELQKSKDKYIYLLENGQPKKENPSSRTA
jgi:hypothetical protein